MILAVTFAAFVAGALGQYAGDKNFTFLLYSSFSSCTLHSECWRGHKDSRSFNFLFERQKCPAVLMASCGGTRRGLATTSVTWRRQRGTRPRCTAGSSTLTSSPSRANWRTSTSSSPSKTSGVSTAVTTVLTRNPQFPRCGFLSGCGKTTDNSPEKSIGAGKVLITVSRGFSVNAPGEYMEKKLKMMKGRFSYWTSGIHRQGTRQWVWQPNSEEEYEEMSYMVFCFHLGCKVFFSSLAKSYS